MLDKNIGDIWKPVYPPLKNNSVVDNTSIPQPVIGTGIGNIKLSNLNINSIGTDKALSWDGRGHWRSAIDNDDITSYLMLIVSLLVKKQIITEDEVRRSLVDIKKFIELSKSYNEDADDILHKIVIEKDIGLSKEILKEIINI